MAGEEEERMAKAETARIWQVEVGGRRGNVARSEEEGLVKAGAESWKEVGEGRESIVGVGKEGGWGDGEMVSSVQCLHGVSTPSLTAPCEATPGSPERTRIEREKQKRKREERKRRTSSGFFSNIVLYGISFNPPGNWVW